MDINLPSRRIYGFGERIKSFALGEGSWTMWASGDEIKNDNGLGGQQSYGVHPFALVQTAVKGEYLGIYFRNTNAMSPVIRHTNNDTAILSYISTGGTIEIYFMFKGSAKDIIKQYQNIIGKPRLPPFWSLGWNTASHSFNNLTLVDTNVKMYE